MDLWDQEQLSLHSELKAACPKDEVWSREIFPVAGVYDPRIPSLDPLVLSEELSFN